jgi:hypothetical protein
MLTLPGLCRRGERLVQFLQPLAHASGQMYQVLNCLNPAAAEEGALYSDKDLEAATERTEVIDFQQTVDVDGIKITPYRAGHVLGAAMFMVEIGGMRLLYTGAWVLAACDSYNTTPITQEESAWAGQLCHRCGRVSVGLRLNVFRSRLLGGAGIFAGAVMRLVGRAGRGE